MIFYNLYKLFKVCNPNYDADYTMGDVSFIFSFNKGDSYGSIQGCEKQELVPVEKAHTNKIKSKYIFDNIGYVFGMGVDPKKDVKKQNKAIQDNEKKHQIYKENLQDILKTTGDEGVGAFLEFLNNPEANFMQLKKPGGKPWLGSETIAVRYNGEDVSLHFREKVQEYWRQKRAESVADNSAESSDDDDDDDDDDDSEQSDDTFEEECDSDEVLDNSKKSNSPAPYQRCMVSGEFRLVQLLHGKIKNVPGARPAGSSIVSFNMKSSESHGLKNGNICSISREASEAVHSMINYFLEKTYHNKKSTGYRQAIQLSDKEIMIYWINSSKEDNDNQLSFLKDLEEDPAIVKNLFSAAYKGSNPVISDSTTFHTCILSGNSGRIAFLEQCELKNGDINKNMSKYFQDIEFRKSNRAFGISELANSAYLPTDTHNLNQLKRMLYLASINGTPIPRKFLWAVLQRIKKEGLPNESAKSQDEHKIEEQEKDEDVKSTSDNFKDKKSNYSQLMKTEARFSLMKLILARLPSEFKREISMSLDENSTSVPYLLGRYLAVVERLQRTSVGKKLNKTIYDNFASRLTNNPQSAIGELALKSNCYKRDNYQDTINLSGEIFSKIQIAEIPNSMSDLQQCEFFVGYYAQRQSLIDKVKKLKQESKKALLELDEEC